MTRPLTFAAFVLFLLILPTPTLAASKKASLTESQYFLTTASDGKQVACLRTASGNRPGQIKRSKKRVTFKETMGKMERELAKLQRKKGDKALAKATALDNKIQELYALCAADPNGGGGSGGGGGPVGGTLTPAGDTLTLADAQHLYRRAGFGGTKAEIELAVATGLRASVERLLTIVPTPEIDQAAQELFDGDPEPQSPNDYYTEQGIRYAFLTQMLRSPNQLREKMAYFWHDLFAASSRVLGGSDAHFIYDYYRIVRENALGNVRTIAREMTINGLMLTWLDGRKNKVGQVNENYAREFWELFSLGRDQYTEHDIAEAARAFTGWTIRYDSQTNKKQVVLIPNYVDNSNKTIFENTAWQQTGNFSALDLVDRTLDYHPTAPRFYTRALYKFFVHQEPSEAALAALATDLKQNNYDVTPVVRRILLSREFFSAGARKAAVKTPVEYALGLLRNVGLSAFDIRYIDRSIQAMGQIVLAPPSVKGWDDDDYWLNDQWLTARASYVHEVLNEASPIEDNFSLTHLLPSSTATGEEFLSSVATRLSISLSDARKSNLNRYLNYIRNWNNTDEPWLFDPRHQTNFEIKARGLLFILAQDEEYQLD